MSDHGTHQDSEHSSDGELKSKTAFKSSFWFVIILVGLFIASLNFIQVMGHEGHEGTEAKTEMHEGEGAKPAESKAPAEKAPASHDSGAQAEHH